jgi:hypothetical protein
MAGREKSEKEKAKKKKIEYQLMSIRYLLKEVLSSMGNYCVLAPAKRRGCAGCELKNEFGLKESVS